MKKLLLLLALAALAVPVLLDRAPLPDFATLQSGDAPAPAAENGYLTLLGLNAPAAEDAHAAGTKIIDGFNAWWPAHKPGLSFWYTLTLPGTDDNTNRMTAQLYNPPAAATPLALLPHATGSTLDCWLMPRNAWDDQKKKFPESSACLTQAELGAALTQNAVLLDRYVAMLNAPRFYEPFGASMIALEQKDLINLNQLYVASLVLYARAGYADDSLRRWIAMQAAFNRITADQQTGALKTILTINYPQALQAILELTPAKAATYQTQLLSVLSPPAFGPGGLDIASLARAEYDYKIRPLDESATLLTRPFYKPGMTRNILAACWRNAAAAIKQPADKINPALTAAANATRQQDRTLDLLTNYLGTSLTFGCDFSGVVDVRLKSLRQKSITAAWVTAVAADIKPDAMAAWLKNAPAALRDPITAQPFNWDAARGTISIAGPASASDPQFPALEIFYPVPLREVTAPPVTFVPPIFPKD